MSSWSLGWRRRPFTAALWVSSLLSLPVLIAGALCGLGMALPVGQMVVMTGLAVAAACDKLLCHLESSASAAIGWVARLTDPAAGQCPVCAMTDLAERARADDELGIEGELRHVVAYGRFEAHWDCAWLVPYTGPEPKPAPLPGPVHAGSGAGVRRRGVARVIGTNQADNCVLWLEHQVPPGIYRVCDADDVPGPGREFLIRILSCEAVVMPVSVYGYRAQLDGPLPYTVTEEQAVRSAAIYPGVDWLCGGSQFSSHYSCHACGQHVRPEGKSFEEMKHLADRHRFFECPAFDLSCAAQDERLRSIRAVPSVLLANVGY